MIDTKQDHRIFKHVVANCSASNITVPPTASSSSKLAETLLKLDVQRIEMEVLQGCESLLSEFDWIYSECSFVALYPGQILAADIIKRLSNRGFRLIEMYNPLHERNG